MAKVETFEGTELLKLDHVQGVDDCVRWYTTEDGRFTVQIDICDSGERSDKKTLMNLWVKHGWLPEWMPTYLCASTTYVNDDGQGIGIYDPTVKMEYYDPRSSDYRDHPDGRRVIDFDWTLEATPENIERLLKEAERLYLNDIPIRK